MIGRKTLFFRTSKYERAEGMRVAYALWYETHLAVSDFPGHWAIHVATRNLRDYLGNSTSPQVTLCC